MKADSIIPFHAAIIMDGNGRWALNRNKPRQFGHKKGMEGVERIISRSKQIGIKVLSLFVFSTENWKRNNSEIKFLFSSLSRYIKAKKRKFLEEDIKVTVMGRNDSIPNFLLKQINMLTEETKDNKSFNLNIVFNYGGRAEVVDASKRIAEDVSKGSLSLNDVNKDAFKGYLYNPEIPDVDLLIRTSGEQRISNFLLWRLAYSELYFTDTLWPDFSNEDLEEAVEEFSRRSRRFGGA